jgi:hypothetical protein
MAKKTPALGGYLIFFHNLQLLFLKNWEIKEPLVLVLYINK